MKPSSCSPHFSASAALRPGVLWHLMWLTLAGQRAVWTSLLVINWGVMIAQGGLITALPLVGGWISGSEVAAMVALVMFKIGWWCWPQAPSTSPRPSWWRCGAAADAREGRRHRLRSISSAAGRQPAGQRQRPGAVLQFVLLLVPARPWLIPGAGC